jgi:hypothetical protein
LVDGRLESIKGGGSDTRFEMTFTTGAVDALVQGQSHVYLRGNLLKNATVTVEPKGAVSVSGACGTDCEPDVHEIILGNQMAHTRVTLIVERPPPPPKPIAFTLSGAKNTASTLPSGADLNGEYTQTAKTCEGKPVYQKGGSGGPVLAKLGERGYWFVGPSGCAVACGGCGPYIFSGDGSSACPASPDGEGCAGKWQENDSSGHYQPNLALRIVLENSAGHPV